MLLRSSRPYPWLVILKKIDVKLMMMMMNSIWGDLYKNCIKLTFNITIVFPSRVRFKIARILWFHFNRKRRWRSWRRRSWSSWCRPRDRTKTYVSTSESRTGRLLRSMESRIKSRKASWRRRSGSSQRRQRPRLQITSPKNQFKVFCLFSSDSEQLRAAHW